MKTNLNQVQPFLPNLIVKTKQSFKPTRHSVDITTISGNSLKAYPHYLIAKPDTDKGPHPKNKRSSKTAAQSEEDRALKLMKVRHYNMLARCLNPAHPAYKNYGGRGISVHQDWHDFYKFLQDMGYPPTPDHSIDRVNNDHWYSKENCKWSTRGEQQSNMSSNVRVDYKGETLTISELARKVNIAPTVLLRRLKIGWSVEKACETPIHKAATIVFNGEEMTMLKASRQYNVSQGLLRARVRLGWTIDGALNSPAREYVKKPSLVLVD
jgi:hypothetical protein